MNMNEFTMNNMQPLLSKRQAATLFEVTDFFLEKELTQVEGVGECRELSDNPFCELFLDLLTPKIEEIVGKPLWPSYSFARRYYRGNSLAPHLDRDSCVYTCTLTLGGSDNTIWPIFCDIDGETIEAANSAGDMLVIQGTKTRHWRNELTSDYKQMLFLHYVPQEEQYKEFAFDGRSDLTLSSNHSGFEERDTACFAENMVNYFDGVDEALSILKTNVKEHQF